jgi:nickel-type superoxide dismutase maturation protease
MFSYFVVKEQSMEPFCQEGDFVLVNKISYLFSHPKVGHIVVLKDPRDSSRHIVKRVTAVKDPFVWVEGDSKEESTDSRNFGWVSLKSLLGQAKVIHKTALLDRSIMN